MSPGAGFRAAGRHGVGFRPSLVLPDRNRPDPSDHTHSRRRARRKSPRVRPASPEMPSKSGKCPERPDARSRDPPTNLRVSDSLSHLWSTFCQAEWRALANSADAALHLTYTPLSPTPPTSENAKVQPDPKSELGAPNRGPARFPRHPINQTDPVDGTDENGAAMSAQNSPYYASPREPSIVPRPESAAARRDNDEIHEIAPRSRSRATRLFPSTPSTNPMQKKPRINIRFSDCSRPFSKPSNSGRG